MKKLITVCTVAGLMLFVSGAKAALTNGSFEDGDFTGWSTVIPSDASATVVSSHTDNSGYGTNTTSWSPTDGSYFALLKTGWPNEFTRLYQSFTVSAGDVLTFDYFWDSGEIKFINDQAEGWLSIGDLNVSLFINNTNSDPWDYWGTDWTSVSYTFPSAGNYTLEFRVMNYDNDSRDSYVGIDNVKLLTPIPAPGAILLGGIGVGLVGWLRRRRTL